MTFLSMRCAKLDWKPNLVVDGQSWYCIPQLGYCGAVSLGVRCTMPGCMATLEGHDPGDEDSSP